MITELDGNPSDTKEVVNKTNEHLESQNLLSNTQQDPQKVSKNFKHSSTVDQSHRVFAEKIFKDNYHQSFDRNTDELASFNWEYVIILKNPDFQADLKDKNQSVSEVFAENLFKDCFKGKKTGNVLNDSVKFSQEFTAFMNVFRDLPVFENGKQLKYGGRVKIQNGVAYDYNTKTNDFLSLVRNVIMFKLVGGLGLKVKQIVSKTGEFIYLVVTADEADLEIEAERTRYSKEMEIALTDIQSLFPCDKNLRPMHLLKTDDEEITSLFFSIQPFIEKSLILSKKAINLDYKYDPHLVSASQWTAYKVYLTLLKEGIQKIEQSISQTKNQMFLFQKLIRESLEKANIGLAKQDKLLNLWDQLGIERPISAFSEFRRSVQDSELYNLWRTYEVDQSGKRSMFSLMERLRLLYSYISTQLSLSGLMEYKIVSCHFPLHNDWQLKGKVNDNGAELDSEDIVLRNILIDFRSGSTSQNLPLVQSWRTTLINQKIPLNKIKNYFGEKIAFYFEFLRYYQTSLIWPSLLGLVVFIVQKTMQPSDNAVLVLNIIYSVFMTIWAIVFLEVWKRKEAAMAIQWGQMKFEQIEIPRPQFMGKQRRSPITDEMDEIHYEWTKRAKYVCLAIMVTSVIITMVLGIVAGLLIFRKLYSNKYTIDGVDYTVIICSILNAIQIQFFNFIYSKVVKKLTDLENHKTQVQYEDSLIVKTFIFQFVNSFNSLCYIAFVKTHVEGCLDEGHKEPTKGVSCLDELNTQLITIFIISYLKNIIELGLPYLRYYIRKYRKNKAKVEETPNKDIRNKIESQVFLDTYLTPDNDGTINDYLELSVQFGYLTLFAIAFPLSTLLAFIGLWLEMFTDKIKVIKLVKRPIPLALKDIGNWWYIFSAISVLAIFSNTALFCFTSRTFEGWVSGTDYEYLIFAIIVVLLLIFRNQLQNWIPDIQEKYQIIMSRHEYIIERLLLGGDSQDIPEDVETYDSTLYFSKPAAKDLSLS